MSFVISNVGCVEPLVKIFDFNGLNFHYNLQIPALKSRFYRFPLLLFIWPPSPSITFTKVVCVYNFS